MSQNGEQADRTWREPPPSPPAFKTIVSALVHFHKLADVVDDRGVAHDGGMEVVFTPAAPLPDGSFQLVSDQVRIPFTADAWTRFKDDVANDGLQAPPSQIQVARAMPPEPKH